MTADRRRLHDADVLLDILDNLPTSIFVKDEDLRFVYSNRLHCDMIGKPESELLGRCDGDFYEATAAAAFMARDRAVLATGAESVAEEAATRADGLSRPILTHKARLQRPDGRTYLIGTNSDLRELKKREELARAMAETVPVGVMQVEEGGEIPFINPLCMAYLGFEEYPSLTAVRDKLGRTAENFPGTASKFEIDLVLPHATARRVMVISSGWLRLAGNANRSAMVSVVDLSELTVLRQINDEISRLNLELADNMRRLKDAQEELVKKGKMEQLGQLTATVAHELRNPLGAVRTSAFVLERKLSGTELGAEAQLKRINNGITRCDSIITQLLDFSRNKMLACQPSDLDQWLAQTVAEEAVKFGANVTIELQRGTDTLLVPFDAQRLQRAIINLLSNACEAMEQSGSITVRSGTDGVRAFIEVRDSGPGMAPEVLNQIREPLFTTKSFGTGLGIPAVEQIAAQHGGTLDIWSEPGRGAVFTIWLPLALPAAECAA